MNRQIRSEKEGKKVIWPIYWYTYMYIQCIYIRTIGDRKRLQTATGMREANMCRGFIY